MSMKPVISTDPDEKHPSAATQAPQPHAAADRRPGHRRRTVPVFLGLRWPLCRDRGRLYPGAPGSGGAAGQRPGRKQCWSMKTSRSRKASCCCRSSRTATSSPWRKPRRNCARPAAISRHSRPVTRQKQAQLAVAKEDVDYAQREFKRQQTLSNKHLSPSSALDAARHSLDIGAQEGTRLDLRPGQNPRQPQRRPGHRRSRTTPTIRPHWRRCSRPDWIWPIPRFERPLPASPPTRRMHGAYATASRPIVSVVADQRRLDQGQFQGNRPDLDPPGPAGRR